MWKQTIYWKNNKSLLGVNNQKFYYDIELGEDIAYMIPETDIKEVKNENWIITKNKRTNARY
jgi:ribosomal protein L19E